MSVVICDRSVVFSGYSIQHYVIKFVSGHLWQVSGFLWLLYTTLCDKVCQWSFVTGQWFSLVTPVFSSNKTATNRHDRTEILLKVVLNTINLNPNLCLSQYKICLTFPIYYVGLVNLHTNVLVVISIYKCTGCYIYIQMYW